MLAEYKLRWLLRAVARLSMSPIFLRLLQAPLHPTMPPLASYFTRLLSFDFRVAECWIEFCRADSLYF